MNLAMSKQLDFNIAKFIQRIKMDILAGIFLIIGGLLFIKGKVQLSSIFYLLSNICFMFIAKTLIGKIAIFVGIVANIYILYKTFKGEYHSDLKKE